MRNLILIAVIIFHSLLFCQAQETINEYLSDTIIGVEIVHYSIPVLSVLIDSAIVNSSNLQNKLLDVEKARLEHKKTRRSWLDHFYIDGNASYGRYNQVVLNQNQTGNVDNGLISQSETGVYYGGVSMKLPVSTIVTSRTEKRIVNNKIEQTIHTYTIAKDDIIQVITEEYYTLIYLEQSTKAFRDVVQTLNISYIKSLKDIENGQMDLDDFALLVSTRGKAIDQYLKTKSGFYTQYRKLELLSGYSF